MTKNPILRAVAALAYIATIASFVMFGPKIEHNAGVLAPISFLSIFTLSAGIMGYLFVAEPLKMYLDGDKEGAMKFFLKTLGSFALLTLIVLAIASAIQIGS